MVNAGASLSVDSRPLALVKGGGDLASGVAVFLIRAGFAVLMTETAKPTAVRRAVAFAEAVYEGQATVEEVEGVLVRSLDEAQGVMRTGSVAVLVDPEAHARLGAHPDLLIDAVMAKRNLGTTLSDAPLVVALGPGFVAGTDSHAVIETMRGDALGRVIVEGRALPDTGIPAERGGFGEERVLRSPCPGVFTGLRNIGDRVKEDEIVGVVASAPVGARLDGTLRGILHSGLTVRAGSKLGDVDPSLDREQCFFVSDKATAVARGVLEAASIFQATSCALGRAGNLSCWSPSTIP
jgi:xanthine dehydrogenase accessory factor